MRFKSLFLVFALATASAAVGYAQDARKGVSDAMKKHAAEHRVMAEAHTNAATCLEAGKGEKDCEAQLQKDCKGLGIGKNCGMKHKH